MPKRQREAQDKMVNKKKGSGEIEDIGELRNKFMTYFLLFFPTIILITIPGSINGSVLLGIAMKVLIAFYQFVTLKTFVDKHYEE